MSFQLLESSTIAYFKGKPSIQVTLKICEAVVTSELLPHTVNRTLQLDRAQTVHWQQGKASSSKLLHFNPSGKQEDLGCTWHISAFTDWYTTQKTPRGQKWSKSLTWLQEILLYLCQNELLVFQCMDKRTEKRKSSIATSSKNSKLYETTPLKLHTLQYHMYGQVQRKN